MQDDNNKSAGFDIKLEGSLFSASTYRYYKHGDFYDAGGFQSARSAYNMQHDPLKLWDTQLNFAVHCATSALGVSVEHLNAQEPLVRALYRFHAYYHTWIHMFFFDRNVISYKLLMKLIQNLHF